MTDYNYLDSQFRALRNMMGSQGGNGGGGDGGPVCHACGRRGHMAKQCPKRSRWTTRRGLSRREYKEQQREARATGSAPAAPPARPPPPHLPQGWTACWDAASGRYYYVAIGRSQWEVPTAPPSLPPPPPPPPATGGQ
ncbi:hypothetical protein ACHAPJ_005143 [Fusarium lateritium]